MMEEHRSSLQVTASLLHNSSRTRTQEARDLQSIDEMAPDPWLMLVILVALLCCAAGVLSTLYVIRKSQRLQEEARRYGPGVYPKYVPVYRPALLEYAPACKPVTPGYVPVYKPAIPDCAPDFKPAHPGYVAACKPDSGIGTSPSSRQTV